MRRHDDRLLVAYRYERNTLLPSPVSIECDEIVKLGDFGTSTILSTSRATVITLSSFTTFENTPPEYMYGGDAVHQVNN